MEKIKRDRKEYTKRYVTEKRRRVKLMLVERLGGKCYICGYNRCVWALDFHHIDRSTKLFSIGNDAYTKSLPNMLAEADKCILLCSNCHREVEAGYTKLIIHE